MEINGSKIESLSKQIADLMKKMDELSKNPKTTSKQMKDLKEKFNTVKDDAKEQIDYLKFLKKSVIADDKLSAGDKAKINQSLELSLEKTTIMFNIADKNIKFIKAMPGMKTENVKSVEEIEAGGF